MSKKKDAIDALYERGKQLFEKLNNPQYFQEPLRDSVIIANFGREKDNLKSYDTLEKADLLDYSMKPNGNSDSSKLKESISNTYLESSENGSKREGFLNSEGKYVKVDISQYKSLVLKYGKISFNNVYMNNSFVNNNDILFLESKVPIFKAKNSDEIIYDTLKNYHQQGSDKEDRNNLVNINQSNTHKINLDENNFAPIAASTIFIFLHKIIHENPRRKPNGSKKNISSAQNTEVIQKPDVIIGYAALEMNKIFLSEDFKYKNKLNIVEKKRNEDTKKNEKKNSNKKGALKDKETKEKKEAIYDEKGERIIGTLELTCHLKRPYQKIFQDNNNKLISSSISNNNNKNNQINNINNINNNDNLQSSPMKEFVIGQPAVYNLNNQKNQNNQNIQKNNNYKYNSNSKQDDYNENEFEDLKNEPGIQKIQTDINGDILILYLKINELKASNDVLASQTSINNINNINEQLNNDMNKNKNIIFYNYNGPQPAKRNYFLRHKIFPDNKDSNSEIIWNKVSPDFNYNIQMPFTLNQKTAELLDNGKFIVEIWVKGENKNECLGIVSFELRNVLESLKVDENTITTLQLYKNTFPYIIYDDYFQVTPIMDAPDLGALYLKTLIGIGTPSQVNNFDNLIKKTQQSTYNKYNGLYNSTVNNNNNKNNNVNDNKEKDVQNKNEEKNNISLDPFKEEDNKDLNKDDINNTSRSRSRAVDINVDGIMEKNHKNLENNNIFISKESSINQKDMVKKSESFEDQPSKKKNS